MDSSLLTTAQRKASDDCKQKNTSVSHSRKWSDLRADCRSSYMTANEQHDSHHKRTQTSGWQISNHHSSTHSSNQYSTKHTHTHTHTQTPITDLVMSLCFYLCLFSSTNPYSSNSLVGWGLMALSTQSRSNLADWDCKHFWLAFCTVLSAARLLNDWSQRWIPSEFSAQNAKF